MLFCRNSALPPGRAPGSGAISIIFRAAVSDGLFNQTSIIPHIRALKCFVELDKSAQFVVFIKSIVAVVAVINHGEPRGDAAECGARCHNDNDVFHSVSRRFPPSLKELRRLIIPLRQPPARGWKCLWVIPAPTPRGRQRLKLSLCAWPLRS